MRTRSRIITDSNTLTVCRIINVVDEPKSFLDGLLGNPVLSEGVLKLAADDPRIELIGRFNTDSNESNGESSLFRAEPCEKISKKSCANSLTALLPSPFGMVKMKKLLQAEWSLLQSSISE